MKFLSVGITGFVVDLFLLTTDTLGEHAKTAAIGEGVTLQSTARLFRIKM